MENPLTLLIVDGHRGVREALVRRLQSARDVRYVTGVSNLTAAFDMLYRIDPDTVVFDPKTINGDPLGALRTMSQGARPVVILTSSIADDEAATFLHAGASALLLKGAPGAEMLACLRRLNSSHFQHLTQRA